MTMPDPTDPAPADETTMHRDYIEKTLKHLEGCVADLRRLLADPPENPREEGERIYNEIGRERQWLAHAFDPKPTGSWRDAIGCAPRRPGGSNEKPEDVIRRLRGHDDEH
jgi:hypothetical protein